MLLDEVRHVNVRQTGPFLAKSVAVGNLAGARTPENKEDGRVGGVHGGGVERGGVEAVWV